MKTNRFLTGVFETSYQGTAHDRECRHQQRRSRRRPRKVRPKSFR